ncbi:hypothetical protein CBR_g41672 [Chara braunii]|uniref:LysM domain-containing protein n=1 Tax=Chara braunii TaxID=69332 RepID=A0A388LWA5_CHABU|nr:hypothetical protein CBR_g41672 [Chara braunii]|eukprot:GBG86608.1 hypothetical protein CBR_g41672 [Chara braunii]
MAMAMASAASYGVTYAGTKVVARSALSGSSKASSSSSTDSRSGGGAAVVSRPAVGSEAGWTSGSARGWEQIPTPPRSGGCKSLTPGSSFLSPDGRRGDVGCGYVDRNGRGLDLAFTGREDEEVVGINNNPSKKSEVGRLVGIPRARAGNSGGRLNPFRFLNWLRSKRGGKEQEERASATDTTTKPGQHNVYYTVKPGDTLESVARQFDTRPQFLIEANDILNPTNLSPGQVLWIPHVYIVRAGDTLSAIAHKLGVPMSRLQEVNGIDNPDYIFQEDALVIPPPTGGDRGGEGAQSEGQERSSSGVQGGRGGSSSGGEGGEGGRGGRSWFSS